MCSYRRGPAGPSPAPAADTLTGHPSHRRGLRSAELPELTRELRSRKASYKSSESGRSRAAPARTPGAQRKQAVLGVTAALAYITRAARKAGTNGVCFFLERSSDFQSFTNHPPSPPHTLLSRAEGPGRALPEDQLLFKDQCRGLHLLPFIFTFIFITGRHPTPARLRGPGGRAARMRRTRRARVLLKDTLLAARRKCPFSVPEVASPASTPVLPGGAGSAGFRAGAAFRRSAPPRARLPSVSFSGRAFRFLPHPAPFPAPAR